MAKIDFLKKVSYTKLKNSKVIIAEIEIDWKRYIKNKVKCEMWKHTTLSLESYLFYAKSYNLIYNIFPLGYKISRILNKKN